MPDRFVALTPRIGAKVVMRREEVLEPGFGDECREALERHGVLLFPQIGFSDEEQIVYRHEWQIGDLLMRDNCGVMHRAIPYAANSGRLMHRTVLHGVERIDGVEGTS